jgi:hypothetical protein
MIILAHRGFWRERENQNSLASLQDALAQGFGIETDIRDCGGELVISHDPPIAGALPFTELLTAYRKIESPSLLALNIKADGLQDRLSAALAFHEIPAERYFLFDMATPDALGYLKKGVPCFTRQSEIEPVPAFLSHAVGIWLDCFSEDWIKRDVIRSHCEAGRRVALVSPELHGREWGPSWAEWREADRELGKKGYGQRLMLCTDHPVEARAYFDASD